MHQQALDNLAEAFFEASCESPETIEEALREFGIQMQDFDFNVTAVVDEDRSSPDPQLEGYVRQIQRTIDGLGLRVGEAIDSLESVLARLDAQGKEIDAIKEDLRIG